MTILLEGVVHLRSSDPGYADRPEPRCHRVVGYSTWRSTTDRSEVTCDSCLALVDPANFLHELDTPQYDKLA